MPLAVAQYSAILIRQDEGGDAAYWSYPANRLFNTIGAKFAFETDNTGTFVGSR
jgi:hypothetical protein